MGYDDAPFLQKLRMNNIFPAEGAGLPNPLIGMPDFNSGRRFPPQQAQLPAIANQVIRGPAKPLNYDDVLRGDVNKPKNVVYNAPESDQFGTNIVMGTSDIDRRSDINQAQNQQLKVAQLSQYPKIAALGINQEKVDLAKFKANNPNYKFSISKGGNIQAENPHDGSVFDTGVDSGTLSDEERQNLITDRGLKEIDAKGNIQKDLQSTRGNQAIQQIGARLAGAKDTASTRYNSPTQQVAAQKAAITQIQTTRPDLAKYLIKDPTSGVMSIDPNTPLDLLSQISGIINPQKDIQLPSSGNSPLLTNRTPTTRTPTSSTPTTPGSQINDPLGIR